MIIECQNKNIATKVIILSLSFCILTSFSFLISVSFIPYALAFGQDLPNSRNNDSQQIVFNLKDWVSIENYNYDEISILQTSNDSFDFPDTSIIIAMDGNNNILNNGDTTPSGLLKVDFVGQIDLTGSSQIIFECSIDSSTFEICTSPNIIDNLNIGTHSFEVRAIDQVGKIDETPVHFTWTIIDLSERLSDIETIVEKGDISSILKNNLNVILREIQTLVNQNDPNNNKEICDNLEEFILQITNNINDISVDNANALVKNINSILDKMQC